MNILTDTVRRLIKPSEVRENLHTEKFRSAGRVLQLIDEQRDPETHTRRLAPFVSPVWEVRAQLEALVLLGQAEKSRASELQAQQIEITRGEMVRVTHNNQIGYRLTNRVADVEEGHHDRHQNGADQTGHD